MRSFHLFRARSSIEAFTSLNYTVIYTSGSMDTLLVYQHIPDMVRAVIWDLASFKHCLARNTTNLAEVEEVNGPGHWQMGTQGCIKKAEFPDGIPIWKSFMFHFWGDVVSPLGGGWTLAPENYPRWGEGNNHYLGAGTEPPFLRERLNTDASYCQGIHSRNTACRSPSSKTRCIRHSS